MAADVVVQLRGGTDPLERPPLLPAGEYELAYVSRKPRFVFKTPKLEMRFRIVSQGEHFGVTLSRWYQLREIYKDGKRFRFGWKSDLAHEFANVFDYAPDRADLLPVEPYKNIIIVGEVATVTERSGRRAIHPSLQYSKIARLVRRAQ